LPSLTTEARYEALVSKKRQVLIALPLGEVGNLARHSEALLHAVQPQAGPQPRREGIAKSLGVTLPPRSYVLRRSLPCWANVYVPERTTGTPFMST